MKKVGQEMLSEFILKKAQGILYSTVQNIVPVVAQGVRDRQYDQKDSVADAGKSVKNCGKPENRKRLAHTHQKIYYIKNKLLSVRTWPFPLRSSTDCAAQAQLSRVRPLATAPQQRLH